MTGTGRALYRELSKAGASFSTQLTRDRTVAIISAGCPIVEAAFREMLGLKANLNLLVDYDPMWEAAFIANAMNISERNGVTIFSVLRFVEMQACERDT